MIKRAIIIISILILWESFCCFQAFAQVNTAATAQTIAITDTATQLSATTTSSTPASYTTKGADTCAKCHDEDSKFPVYAIYKTKHAQPADVRTPFASLQCETCHGPGEAHAKSVRPGEKQAPIITFGTNSKLSTPQQNQICLDCHHGQDRSAWHSSAHERNEVSCTRCHQVHTSHDPVLDTHNQPMVCYQCHKKAQAEFLKPTNHPVRFGKLVCSDCHQIHGSNTTAILKYPTINQTCYNCHAEKRGPLLWEHAPVTENCNICHFAHGSAHSSLLKQRAPILCQQCHSQFGHPSVPRAAGNLPANNPSAFLLAGSCTNCHSQVHGSNHPSGAKLMR